MQPRQFKATISLKKAIIKFLEQGYYVFQNCSEQGPIDIIVVNPANGRSHYFDVKTSKDYDLIILDLRLEEDSKLDESDMDIRSLIEDFMIQKRNEH